MNKFLASVLVTGVAVGLLAGCGQPSIPSNRPTAGSNSNTLGNLTSNQSSVQNNTSQSTSSRVRVGRMGFPAPLHTVVVIEENHSYAEIAGNRRAPYLNSLMRSGANMTNAHGVEHPSEPNYLDLFSGSNQGITSDACPNTFNAPNLATELAAAHLTFMGYSESLPKVGYTGCSNATFLSRGTYARKHSPWVNFTNVPATENVPWSDFPKNFNNLPTVSFVVPNLNNDMHNGTVAQGDAWLKNNLSAYAKWAMTHHSLLIVTFDEDDNSQLNQIPTILIGQMVKPGQYNQTVNHYNVLRTIEELYNLPYVGHSAHAAPIQAIWESQ